MSATDMLRNRDVPRTYVAYLSQILIQDSELVSALCLRMIAGVGNLPQHVYCMPGDNTTPISNEGVA